MAQFTPVHSSDSQAINEFIARVARAYAAWDGYVEPIDIGEAVVQLEMFLATEDDLWPAYEPWQAQLLDNDSLGLKLILQRAVELRSRMAGAQLYRSMGGPGCSLRF